MHRRRFLQGALAAPMIGSFPLSAGAQAWPSRNITLVVAFPPGGQADLAARPVAQALEKILGKSVVVDNRAGAGGLVGNAFVARAEPDGHTLLMALSSMIFLPDAERLYDRKPSYELDSFVPIARVLADPGVLGVRADAPWKSVADLVADARKRPGQISYSSSGNYGASHVPFEMFQRAADCKLLHVPYRGGGPALTAFLGSQVDITAQAPGVINPHARDGKVRLLAHWGGKPTPELKGIPTMIELGYKDVEYYIWAGLFAPKGTPAPVIARLREAMKQVMGDTQVTSIYEKAGSPAAYMDQGEFAAFVEADAKRLIPVIKSIGRLDEK
ncbi:MAG: tripartite tricarboxylate transporter substrate binding protein [Xanthobacteraceae bacterium]|nr:tripartite tricarboxylate transporter substrate binding protein [Xanthobacteraceae bacterium]